MRTTAWDRVASSAPLDATAAVVRDGSGDLWEAKRPDTWMHWKAPPPALEALKDGAPDLTGRRFGRMTVIRFHGRSGKSNPRPVWLVRCQCGDYEVRRAETIMKDADPDACCYDCGMVKALRNRASKPATKKTREASARALDEIARASRLSPHPSKTKDAA